METSSAPQKSRVVGLVFITFYAAVFYDVCVRARVRACVVGITYPAHSPAFQFTRSKSPLHQKFSLPWSLKEDGASDGAALGV